MRDDHLLIRTAAKLMFMDRMQGMSGEDFQQFFQKIMQMRHQDFIPVRTWGSEGDHGADGLLPSQQKLYACYSFYSSDISGIRDKFRRDVTSAVRQPAGEFKTFVFVYNDRIGLKPDLSSAIIQARSNHPGLDFEQCSEFGLWLKCLALERFQLEELLGSIPLEVTNSSFGLADLKPLLDELAKQPVPPNDVGDDIPIPDELKLTYNELASDDRQAILDGFHRSRLVTKYFNQVRTPIEYEEISKGFRIYYRQLKAEGLTVDETFWELQRYVFGSQHPHPNTRRAANTILSHFFEHCHIFENPPEGWGQDVTEGS